MDTPETLSELRGLTLWQPWASAVSYGVKNVETRSWRTNYRGPLAIHSSLEGGVLPSVMAQTVRTKMTEGGAPEVPFPAIFPAGKILAISVLVDVIPTWAVALPDLERAWGDYSDGRWAFFLGRLRPIVPIPCKGAQGLWKVPPEVRREIQFEYMEAPLKPGRKGMDKPFEIAKALVDCRPSPFPQDEIPSALQEVYSRLVALRQYCVFVDYVRALWTILESHGYRNLSLVGKDVKA